LELVTEPVIHDAETAVRFGKELQLLLRYIGAGEANMEKGQMRVEVNISIAPEGEKTFGTKVEIKNINSFRAVAGAIAYERERQADLLDRGESVVQETRGWDETKQKTFSQRKKENANDYRYFPDPDLPKLYLKEVPEFSEEVLRKEIPELPQERRARYVALGLKEEDADMYVSDEVYGNFFDEVSKQLNDVKLSLLAANYISSDLAGLVKNTGKAFEVTPRHFTTLIHMVAGNKISSRGAKDLLSILFETDSDPKTLAKERGLLQQSDEGVLKKIAEEVIAENEAAVAEYKAGKESSLQFLVGQGMKKSKGSANPQVLKEVIMKLL